MNRNELVDAVTSKTDMKKSEASKAVDAVFDSIAEALKGASVVVDVLNSPPWEDAAVLKFFETSTRNLLKYEAAAGVGHHVALSVVGRSGWPKVVTSGPRSLRRN